MSNIGTSISWDSKIARGYTIKGNAITDHIARDAMDAIAKDIPDPVEYAYHVSGAIASALMGAQNNCIPDHVCRKLGLVNLGLVEAGSKSRRQLTAFGLKVRRALKDEDA